MFRVANCAFTLDAIVLICVSAVCDTASRPVTASIVFCCAWSELICGRRSNDVCAATPNPA